MDGFLPSNEFDLQPEHALDNSILMPTALGFVVARVINNGLTLELRWSKFATKIRDEDESMVLDEANEGSYSTLDNEVSLPPTQFLFSDKIVPSVALSEDVKKSALYVVVLTQNGFLYRLTFSGPAYFSASELPGNYSVDHGVTLLNGRSPILLHGIDTDSVLVACTDGSIIKVDQPVSSSNQDAYTAAHSGKGFSQALLLAYSTVNSPVART